MIQRPIHRTLPIALALLGAIACRAHGRPAAPPEAPSLELPAELSADGVMSAMLAELRRSATRLRLDGYEAPYYVQYTVKDLREVHLGGKLGAIYVDDTDHARNAFVDVRVGAYAFDSSEDVELEWVEQGMYEPASVVPLAGADTTGLRHALWLLTDLRYKQALSSYLKLKGQRVYQVERDGERKSFSPAPAVVAVDEPVALTIDRPRWERVVREVGEILGADPAVFDSEATIQFQVETRWLVNTEGARVRTVQPMYAFHASAYTRADDGMLLEHSADFYAPTEAGLPADAELLVHARRLVSELAALRAAPVLDPYTGPAILEPAATGVFFHEVLGHRLEGHRQQGDESGQTFAKHLGREILPPFLSLIDDPTLALAGDVPLNGHYDFDDEGVASERVTLVDKGVLRAFLNPRKPPKGFDRSNGHGRAQGTRRPVGRMGNLIVVAHQAVTHGRLRDLLLEQVRRQRKPYGLIVRDISGGSTNTSSYGYQAFKAEARMVYKVDVETGKETLVRGVDVVGTPLVTIGKIIAASDRVGIFNGYCGAESGMVPVSTVAPATLFSEIELQRSARARSKGPVLAPPSAKETPTVNAR